MKKIFKIFLVLLIAINFFFANSVKTKATSFIWPAWWNEYHTTNGVYESAVYYPGGTQVWGTSMSEGSAVYKFNMFSFFNENLMPGAKLTFTTDFTVTGLRPEITTWRFYLRRYNADQTEYVYDPIYSPGDYATSETYNADYDNMEINYQITNFIYENTTTYEYHGIMITFEFDQSRNILYSMHKVHNLAVDINPTEQEILQDTNNKVSGIFDTVKNIFTGITELPSNIATSVSGFFDNVVNSVMNIGNMITNGLTTLGNFIIDGLKSLFIPSDQYFKNYFDSLYDFFSDKLGILIMPIDILGSLMDNILNLGNGDGYIHVPAIKFMGKTLIPKTDYNLKADVQQVMGNYYDMYYLLTDVIIYFMLFNMAKKKFDEIVRGTN